jgi:hypothetical protein
VVGESAGGRVALQLQSLRLGVGMARHSRVGFHGDTPLGAVSGN